MSPRAFCGRPRELTLSSLSMASMCVAVSMSTMAVSMSSFHVPHELLHHKEGDNATENP